MEWPVALASLAYALGPTTVIFGKHIDKHDPDKAKGIHTLPVIIGEKTARAVARGMMVLMYLIVIGLVIAGFFTPAMLVVLLGLVNLPQVWRRYGQPYPKERPADFPAEAWPTYFAAPRSSTTAATGCGSCWGCWPMRSCTCSRLFEAGPLLRGLQSAPAPAARWDASSGRWWSGWLASFVSRLLVRRHAVHVWRVGQRQGTTRVGQIPMMKGRVIQLKHCIAVVRRLPEVEYLEPLMVRDAINNKDRY